MVPLRRSEDPAGRPARATLTAPARDLDGASRSVPHDAVWRDAERRRPHGVGLATGPSVHAAVLAALSDRLGADASSSLRHGDTLRLAPVTTPSTQVVLFDGRGTHAIPTVVAVSETFVRWGAGGTWDLAVRRAFGESGPADPAETEAELATLRAALRAAGYEVAVVDLGSDTLRSAGLHRVSVQLTAVV